MSDDIAEVQVKVEVGSLVEVVDITIAEPHAESSTIAPTKVPSAPTPLPSFHACSSTRYAIPAPSATRISPLKAIQPSASIFSSSVRAPSASFRAPSSSVRAYNSSVRASGVLSSAGTPVLALSSATYLAPLAGTKTLWCTLIVLFFLDIVAHHAA